MLRIITCRADAVDKKYAPLKKLPCTQKECNLACLMLAKGEDHPFPVLAACEKDGRCCCRFYHEQRLSSSSLPHVGTVAADAEDDNGFLG
jgi:hypothetical protein